MKESTSSMLLRVTTSKSMAADTSLSWPNLEPFSYCVLILYQRFHCIDIMHSHTCMCHVTE